MTRMKFVISVDVPGGCDAEEMAEYINHAMRVGLASFLYANPDSAIKDLKVNRVRVYSHGEQEEKEQETWAEENRKLRKYKYVYACGYEDPDSPGSFGMFHGPHPSLRAMLDVVPDDERANPCIIAFDNENDTSEVVYRWEDGRWHYVKGEED